MCSDSKSTSHQGIAFIWGFPFKHIPNPREPAEWGGGGRGGKSPGNKRGFLPPAQGPWEEPAPVLGRRHPSQTPRVNCPEPRSPARPRRTPNQKNSSGEWSFCQNRHATNSVQEKRKGTVSSTKALAISYAYPRPLYRPRGLHCGPGAPPAGQCLSVRTLETII